MNTGKVIAITLSVILIVFLVGAYGFLASRGLSARKKPSNFEYSIANTALGVSIPSEAKKQKNPLNTTQDDLVEAKKHYQEHCAVCHAKDGSGQTDTSASMSPEVPDLRANHIPVVVVNTAKSGFVGRVSIHHCEPKGLNYKIGLYALASHAREL